MPPPAQPPLQHTHLKPDDAARAPLQVLVHLQRALASRKKNIRIKTPAEGPRVPESRAKRIVNNGEAS